MCGLYLSVSMIFTVIYRSTHYDQKNLFHIYPSECWVFTGGSWWDHHHTMLLEGRTMDSRLFGTIDDEGEEEMRMSGGGGWVWGGLRMWEICIRMGGGVVSSYCSKYWYIYVSSL